MEGHNMKLTREEQKEFDGYLKQEQEGKRLQVEADHLHEEADALHDKADEQHLEGRAFELEAFWKQGSSIVTFAKKVGCAVAHAAPAFGLEPRWAQKLAKYFREYPCPTERTQDGIVFVGLAAQHEHNWLKAQGAVKQAKKREKKAKLKAVEKDEAETIALLADDILSSGKARQYAALSETALRGEDAEAGMAKEKVEAAAEKFEAEPEVFMAAARKAGEVEEQDKQKKREREERHKLRSVLAAKYDELSKAEYIDWVVAHIKELGEL